VHRGGTCASHTRVLEPFQEYLYLAKRGCPTAQTGIFQRERAAPRGASGTAARVRRWGMGLNPMTSVVRALGHALRGRLPFPREPGGAVFTAADGRRFTVFRHVVVDPVPGQPDRPGAVFIPRFHVAGMSVRLNRWFSLLPIPFFVGLPGFRSKRWMVDEATG